MVELVAEHFGGRLSGEMYPFGCVSRVFASVAETRTKRLSTGPFARKAGERMREMTVEWACDSKMCFNLTGGMPSSVQMVSGNPPLQGTPAGIGDIVNTGSNASVCTNKFQIHLASKDECIARPLWYVKFAIPLDINVSKHLEDPMDFYQDLPRRLKCPISVMLYKKYHPEVIRRVDRMPEKYTRIADSMYMDRFRYVFE